MASQKKTKNKMMKSSNRRMRRTVMGTLSAVFMISAIIVALIPTPELKADDPTSIKVRTDASEDFALQTTVDSMIFDYSASGDTSKIFADYTGLYRVIYSSNKGEYVGTIVSYYGQSPKAQTGTLTIPDEIGAFLYNPAQDNYIAVNVNRQPLYYVGQEEKQPEVDPDTGAAISDYVPQIMYACTAERMDDWKNKQLYIVTDSSADITQPYFTPQDSYVSDQFGAPLPTSPSEQLNITIQNIGSYKYNYDIQNSEKFGDEKPPVDGTDSSGKPVYKPVFDKETGVFEGSRKFSNLVIPENILAIGHRAFAGCQMTGIDIANKIMGIGNEAFLDCNQLSSVHLAENTELRVIGNSAFAGCTSLTNIKIPDQVNILGHYCFENCTNLQNVYLDGMNEDGNTNLTQIGNGLFYNCSSLQKVVFPIRLANIDDVQFTFFKCRSLTDLTLPNYSYPTGSVFKANNVLGCYSLKNVTVLSTELKLDCEHNDADHNLTTSHGDIYTGGDDIFSRENLGYGVGMMDDYEVSEEFCIIAPEDSYAFNYATVHEFAVGYADSAYAGWLSKREGDYTYTIDEDGVVVKFTKVATADGSSGKEVCIPDKIAGRDVKCISKDAFKENDQIVFVYIPGSVETIEANAFEGCTSLRTVYFEDVNNVHIGENAFYTKTPKNPGDFESDGTAYNGLCFIGDIVKGSEPYEYAMNLEHNFNDPNNQIQYIKLCSKFPECLEVELKVTKDDKTNQVISAIPTLVGIPTLEKAASGNYSLLNVYKDNNYVRTNVSENSIALHAWESNYKYENNASDFTGFSEDDTLVLDAIRYITIPDGVAAFENDLFQNSDVRQITTCSVKDIPAQAFKDCSSLESFEMLPSGDPNGETIGDYAFENCDLLDIVKIPNTVASLGKLPFYDCDILTDVAFNGSPVYSCEDAIIYENDPATQSKIIVEVLKGRGSINYPATIETDELAGVTEIREGAFENCTGIRKVYLDGTTVKKIPNNCFYNASNLTHCYLPKTVESIEDNAFKGTALEYCDIPNPTIYIRESAFQNPDGTFIQDLILRCPTPSSTENYCAEWNGITAQTHPLQHTVIFKDENGNQIGEPQLVNDGEAAISPIEAYRDGYILSWVPSVDEVYKDMETTAKYDKKYGSSDPNKVTVVFLDYDRLRETPWDIQEIDKGTCPTMPTNKPYRTGYTFTGWMPSNFTQIPVYEDKVIEAYYDVDPNYVDGVNPDTTFTVTFEDYNGNILDTQTVTIGKCPVATAVTPVRKGYTFSSWSPSNYTEIPVYDNMTVKALYQKGNTSNVDTSDNSGKVDSSTSKDPAVDGSTSSDNGSGSTGNTGADVSDGNTASSNTKNNNKGNGGSSSNVSGNSTGSNGNRVPTSDTNESTRVEVTKSGISNKDLVTATVSGSNDNFVVKISDSEEARAAVEAALLAEYGSLDDIKFFAMDISLYDSTGTSKIEYTNGATVTITMPLPDALAGYAGNNKAGAVKDGAFEKLGSRLITIDNVPCISFVATHFSPYTIYVETNNLTSADVSDATPKTGDPIHPKWFLAIGLALMSVLMFLGKGSKNKIVKVIE